MPHALATEVSSPTRPGTSDVERLARLGILWSDKPPRGAAETASFKDKCPPDFHPTSAPAAASFDGAPVIATLRPRASGGGAYELVMWPAPPCVYVSTTACQMPRYELQLFVMTGGQDLTGGSAGGGDSVPNTGTIQCV